MDPKYEPNFVIEQVSTRGLSYVLRRLVPKQGQLTLLKAHHNQLKLQTKREERDLSSEARITPQQDKPSSAVITLSRLAQQTARPNWTSSDKELVEKSTKGLKSKDNPLPLIIPLRQPQQESETQYLEARIQLSPLQQPRRDGWEPGPGFTKGS